MKGHGEIGVNDTVTLDMENFLSQIFQSNFCFFSEWGDAQILLTEESYSMS